MSASYSLAPLYRKISISGVISGLYTRRGWDLLSTHLPTFHFFVCVRLLQSAILRKLSK